MVYQVSLILLTYSWKGPRSLFEGTDWDEWNTYFTSKLSTSPVVVDPILVDSRKIIYHVRSTIVKNTSLLHDLNANFTDRLCKSL